jgi:hypothetical protein
VVDVAVQEFATGSYWPPSFRKTKLLFCPPQTIILDPVQIAVWKPLACGAPAVVVAVQ